MALADASALAAAAVKAKVINNILNRWCCITRKVALSGCWSAGFCCCEGKGYK